MRDALLMDVEQRFGVNAANAIRYLFENETLDDSLARKHMLKVEAFRRLMDSTADEKQIHSDLSEDFGVSESTVYKTCSGKVY